MKTNMELCIDLKTKLQNDVLMKPGKDYLGILRREIPSVEFGYDDGRYSFIETIRKTAGRRNPHIFDGQYITVTRRDDGSIRLNFKNLEISTGFKVDRYALGVYNELCMALEDLIEEG